jgi:hypothetical protein
MWLHSCRKLPLMEYIKSYLIYRWQLTSWWNPTFAGMIFRFTRRKIASPRITYSTSVYRTNSKEQSRTSKGSNGHHPNTASHTHPPIRSQAVATPANTPSHAQCIRQLPSHKPMLSSRNAAATEPDLLTSPAATGYYVICFHDKANHSLHINLNTFSGRPSPSWTQLRECSFGLRRGLYMPCPFCTPSSVDAIQITTQTLPHALSPGTRDGVQFSTHSTGLA